MRKVIIICDNCDSIITKKPVVYADIDFCSEYCKELFFKRNQHIIDKINLNKLMERFELEFTNSKNHEKKNYFALNKNVVIGESIGSGWANWFCVTDDINIAKQSLFDTLNGKYIVFDSGKKTQQAYLIKKLI